MSLEADSKPDHAAFYRGIARLLSEARGREVPALREKGERTTEKGDKN